MTGKCLTGVLLLASAGAVHGGEVFHWKGGSGEWLDWGETSSWETSAGGVMTDATRLPGADDAIYYPQTNLWANLGGQSWEIGSYDQDATPRTWINHYLYLTNGTLDVNTGYESYMGNHALYDGATFAVKPTVKTMAESLNNAGTVTWTVYSGACLDLRPQKILYFQGYATVKAGGTLILEPGACQVAKAPWPNAYYNYGTAVVTNGLDFSGTPADLNVAGSTNHKANPSHARDGYWAYWALDHFEGTLKLGGSFVRGQTDPAFPLIVAIRGGTVEAVKDTSFVGFDCAVSNNANVTVSVASGANLNMAPFKFGANVAVEKTGPGVLQFGDAAPQTVTVSAGTLLLGAAQPATVTVKSGAGVEVTSLETDLSAIAFEEGSTLVFGGAPVRLDSLDKYEGISFAADAARIVPSSPFFVSDSADVLTAVRDSVAETLDPRFDVVISDGALVLVGHVDNVFDATKGVGLDDPSGWGQDRVPTGQDVTIRGAAAVAFTAGSPEFKSITLEANSALEVTGGTEEAPVVLPPMELHGKVALRFRDGSFASFCNGLTSLGDASALPVFEIYSNAVVAAQDPAFPNRGIYFSNVDFRLYGQLRVPQVMTDAGDILSSQVFFGHAEPGETAYLAFKSEGGSIYAPHNAAAYVGNRSLVSFASPAVGGRVKVVGTIVLRDFHKIQDLTQPDNPSCNTANSGYSFGVNNPTDEPFDVLVDNTLLCPGGPTRFAGASRVRFVNGAALRRPDELSGNTSYGHTRGAFIADLATVAFDGGKLMLDHPCGSKDLGKGFRFDSAEADRTILRLAGGAEMTLWETYGNQNGVCEVTDGAFNVPRYHPPRMQHAAGSPVWTVMASWTSTNTAAFAGFKSVCVPAGGSLRFNATDEIREARCGENDVNYPNPVNAVWWTEPGFWEWHRKTALELPVTGAGDVTVVNTLSGTDFRKTSPDWLVPPEVKALPFPDLSSWSMNLVVRNGENTCTGRISADSSVNAFVHFADGANWAGTVVANGHVRMGDPIREVDQGHAAAPATATFHALELTGDFPLRVWKTGRVLVNDRVNVETAVTGRGRFVLESVEGTVERGDQVVFGRYPARAPLPRVKGCTVSAAPIPGDEDHVTLTATRGPGLVVTLVASGTGSTRADDLPEGEVYRALSAAQGIETDVSFDAAHALTVAPATAVRAGDEYVLENGSGGSATNGLSWNLQLNQSAAMPFSVAAESLFESGAASDANNGYSLYLDVRYADGTSLYGQTYSFKPQTGLGWQKGVVAVVPEKPVRSVNCYLLLRYRDGRVRFREPKLTSYPANDLAAFDTTIVQVSGPTAGPVCLLHDAADPEDGWTALRDGSEAKGFRLGLTRTARGGATFFEARLDSLTDADRAMTFAYSIPLPEGELTWLDDPRTENAVGNGQCRSTANVGCGACALSRWPFGAVRAGGRTYALGYDSDAPAVFRVTANGRLRRLFIAFDLGFAKEKKDARFKFVSFETSGADGFRGAIEKYRVLFPEAYRVRIRRHGIWMAFRRISAVEGWEDFGFGIKEGDGEPAWDDAHGILTTHYTEPASWWMVMKGDGERTMADALAQARAEAADPKGSLSAKSWLASAYYDENGEVTGELCDRPWCTGACWNLNPLPGIPGGDYETKETGPDFEKRYADKSLPEGVDGEYIDSAENHMAPRIDFRRENFMYSKTPLCWAKDSFRPGVSTALAIYEYVRGVADRIHAMGRVVQANGAPYTWPWLIPFVDYGGQETKWIENGEGAWRPQSDGDLLYRMAMSCGKPYCFLMNVKFENLTDEMVEKYFQRCLAYGLMSSFFSPNASEDHYFSRPDLYNRHRPFFLKYGPLQRQVSEAGWRPVNRLAAVVSQDVFAEQFGDRYVTLFNPGDKPATVRVRCQSGLSSARELVTGTTWTFANGETTAEIPPETVRLLDFQ